MKEVEFAKISFRFSPILLNSELPALNQHVLLMDLGVPSGWMHVYRAVTDEEHWFYSSTGDMVDIKLELFSHWLPLDHQHYWDKE